MSEPDAVLRLKLVCDGAECGEVIGGVFDDDGVPVAKVRISYSGGRRSEYVEIGDGWSTIFCPKGHGYLMPDAVQPEGRALIRKRQHDILAHFERARFRTAVATRRVRCGPPRLPAR